MGGTAKCCPFPLLLRYTGLKWLHRVYPPRGRCLSECASTAFGRPRRRWDLFDSGFACSAASQFPFESHLHRKGESVELRQVPLGVFVLLWFRYDSPCHSRYSPLHSRLEDAFLILFRSEVRPKLFHDLIICIYGLLGHRLLLSGAVKCLSSTVFRDGALHHTCKEITHIQTMAFGIISPIVV